jgi:hypothetical protein
MKRLISVFAALLLTAGAAYAQGAPSADAPNAPPRARPRSCSEAPDPARCEARRKALREAVEAARQACKDTAAGPARRECMTRQLCAKAKDPARCEARAAERAKRRRAGPPQQ